jgi:imidazolonepropionase-like amidohydrolase
MNTSSLSIRIAGALAALLAAQAIAQNTLTVPATAQSGPIVIDRVAIHPVTGPVIADGRVRFESGRITAIGGGEVSIDAATVIDASGKRVYPGFIAASTVLGLTEISAVRATNDFAEVGAINPNVRAEVALNPDSELIPVTRANGVLIAHVQPTAGAQGVINGSTALIQLDGWTWEDLVVVAPVGLSIEWPSLVLPEYLPAPLIEQTRKAQAEKRVALEQALADAEAYRSAKLGGSVTQPDLRWEAMLPVLAGELPVFLHANDVEAIEDALDFAARHDLRPILVGGLEAWRLAALLAARKVPVIVGGTHVLPLRRSDPYDAVYANPARLFEAGVQFAIAGPGSAFASANERNLAYHAASAAAYGLPPDEALKAITIHAATLLGVADRLGSLEIGKDATLFLADGDPLELTTRIERAWISGREIDLSDRHSALYRKYRQKYAPR